MGKIPRLSRVEQALDCGLQIRQLVLDDIPEDPRVHPKVFMNQNVSQPGDLLPFHARFAVADGLGEVFGRFTNDFKVPDDRVEGLVVTGEA